MGTHLLWVACKQALRVALVAGRKRKECLQSHLRNLNFCMEKVNAKCWLAEILVIWLLGNYCEKLSMGSQKGQWRRNSNSWDVTASSPYFFSLPKRLSKKENTSLMDWNSINVLTDLWSDFWNCIFRRKTETLASKTSIPHYNRLPHDVLFNPSPIRGASLKAA